MEIDRRVAKLAADFGRPPSEVQIVGGGGSRYLYLRVSPEEIEEYLRRKYPNLHRPVPSPNRRKKVESTEISGFGPEIPSGLMDNDEDEQEA